MQIRRLAADTVAMVVFSTIAAGTIEMGISGMTFCQSLQTRLTATPVNIVAGRPYGLFRDWMFKTTGASDSGWLMTAVVDILSFTMFQMPLYAAILFVSGASLTQIVTSCGTASMLSAVMGRPYGLFLSLCRWIFGVPVEPATS